MSHVSRTILIGFLFLFSSLTQVSAQSVADHLGPLEIELGDDKGWNASLTGGWFLLTNKTDPEAIRYYWIDKEPVASAERTVSTTVVVRGSGSTNSYGGVLFGRAGEDRYIGFTIRNDGAVVVWERTPGGLENIIAENAKAKMDGSDVLTVRETAGRASLSLNGEEIFTTEDQQGFAPSYGIIVIGNGRFGFDGFTIAEAAAQDDLPPPGGGGNTVEDDPLPKPGGGGGDVADQRDGGNQTPTRPQGQEMSPEQIYYSQVLLGTTLGIFFHEFGHALIGETKLPATGPEEDVADGFSAFVLSATVEEGGLNPQEQEFMEEIVKFSSLLWYYNGIRTERAGQSHPWQDEHAPDLKRFRNSFCIIYGSNPQRYEELANKVKLGDRAKFRCKEEYRKRYDAWEAILKTVARNLGPDSPGNYPADHPGGKINLTWGPAQSNTGRDLEVLLKNTGTMTEILGGLEKMFVWPRDLNVEFRDCQEVNAWYDPQAAKVTMCYSLMEELSKVVFEAEGGSTGGGGGGGGGGQQQQNEAVAYLIGTWQSSMQAADGTYEVAVAYYENMTFEVAMKTPYGPAQTLGNWDAQVSGQGQITLQSQPTQWSPKQFCDNRGNCEPNDQQAEQVMVQVIDQNSVQADGVVWRRAK